MLEVYLFIILSFILSLAIDLIYGELPEKIHPVVITGKIITFFKNRLYNTENKTKGFFTVLFTIAVSSLLLIIVMFLSSVNYFIYFILFSVILSSTYSINMLISTAESIENDLNQSIDKARQSVSYLVSRNTDELDEAFIVSATIESLSENITDSYIAPIFYFMIFTCIFLLFDINYLTLLLLIPFIYRISNTLDAMLGYKTPEFINIGFVPAKLDDILNYIPSRIAGIFVIISAYLTGLDSKNSYRIMMRDAGNCPSPNSGYTMAPTAGALNIQLIKKNTYILGDNTVEIDLSHISKAVKLSSMTIFLFTIFILIIITIFYMIL